MSYNHRPSFLVPATMRKSQSFNSFASTFRPIDSGINVTVGDMQKVRSELSDISIISMAAQAKRLAASREKEYENRRVTHDDAEFQMAKKLPDKELSILIRENKHTSRLEDMHGQHLIHWCALTERPLSIIAICNQRASINCRHELNSQDGRGRTALHLAVQGELEYMVTLLLNLGAQTNVLDHSRMMPIHRAAMIGNVTIMQALLSKQRNPNIAGDGGYTPMHFAASADQPEMIDLLIENSASMMLRNSNGTYPIHTAAKSGAARALEALIEGADTCGFDERSVLNLKDREGQLPIHNAVNNGGAEAVIICLKYGSSLLSKRDNGVTPVHYAATQGNLDLLMTMHAFSPDKFKEALHMQDSTERTPIHWAAIFNHESVVKYLIKMSNVNTLDVNKHTPLLSAASNACTETLMLLLAHRETSTETLDINQRNALHLAIRQGVKLEDNLNVWKSVNNIARRCNEEDKTGSTPLHYAAWNGEVNDVRALLSLGANTNVKNKQRQNPFHIACKNGCYDVCVLLLNEKEGSRLKNEQDETGQSPLHMAAARGYVMIVNILLQRGAVISKDKSVNSPLHLAAAGGHVLCIYSLLSVHRDLLDTENVDGNTALHLAASKGHPAAVDTLLTAGAEIVYNTVGKCFYDDALTMGYRNVVEVLINHDRWHEILSVFSQFHGQLILGLIHYLPLLCISVLDRCVITSSMDKNSPNYSVTYNFRYLQLGDEYTNFAKVYRLHCSPLLPIERMLEHEREDCLRHRLITVYLRQKWRTYGRLVNFLDICIYCMYMGSLTMFVATHAPMDHYHTYTKVERPVDVFKLEDQDGVPVFKSGYQVMDNFTDWAVFDFDKPWFPDEARTYKQTFLIDVMLLVVCTYSFLQTSKILVQIFTSGWEYLRDVFVYVEAATYLSSIYFVAPFLAGYSTHTQWQAGAMAIFLAWFNFLVLCQRFELFGLYIVMYIEIMKTLVQILFIFIVLMVAFGLSFYILQSKEDLGTHSNPFLSMYRTFILVFELDFIWSMMKPYSDKKSQTLHFNLLSFFFLALFLFFMPLLLVNLMIGLAVGDIQSVLQSANQKKLATQVKFHSRIEKKIHMLSRWTPEKLTLYPNQVDRSFKRVFLNFLGIYSDYNEDDSYAYSFKNREKNSPTMLSLAEARRELAQVKNNLKQIMHRLEIDNMDEYEYQSKDTTIDDGVDSATAKKPWLTANRISVGSNNGASF